MARRRPTPSGTAHDRGTAFLGVSGFGYPSWRGGFYPPQARPEDFLRLYAERLPSVELNATGRRFPTAELLARWASATPASFRFAIKLTGSVIRRPAAAGGFCELVRAMGERLGPVLVQLPALGRHDGDLARALFARLADDLRYAIELKDTAWDAGEVRSLADALAVTIVNDPLPGDDFEYHRFRDPPYTAANLAALARSLEPSLARGAHVYGYFKHEDEPTGPAYAAELLELLGAG